MGLTLPLLNSIFYLDKLELHNLYWVHCSVNRLMKKNVQIFFRISAMLLVIGRIL